MCKSNWYKLPLLIKTFFKFSFIPEPLVVQSHLMLFAPRQASLRHICDLHILQWPSPLILEKWCALTLYLKCCINNESQYLLHNIFTKAVPLNQVHSLIIIKQVYTLILVFSFYKPPSLSWAEHFVLIFFNQCFQQVYSLSS